MALSPATAATGVFPGGGAFAGVDWRAGAVPLGGAVPGRGAALGAFVEAGAASYIASTLCGAIEGGGGMPIGAGAAMDSAIGWDRGGAIGIMAPADSGAGDEAAPHAVTSWRAARCASAAAMRRTARDLG